MNSWSTKANDNSAFRENVLSKLDLDILCLNETFLAHDEVIDIPNYKWYGHNRKNKHKKARRGAGGVGILVHSRVHEYFNIQVLDAETEDILWIKLQLKNSNTCICLCTCYLPPKGSSHKVDAETFFDTITNHIYNYQNKGFICICGDINSRMGDHQDIIEGVDNVPLRSSIDNNCNEYGDLFRTHLTNCNMCVLNGRQGNSQYTCISNKGKSVVDYTWVPHEQLHYWSNFVHWPSVSNLSVRSTRVEYEGDACHPLAFTLHQAPHIIPDDPQVFSNIHVVLLHSHMDRLPLQSPVRVFTRNLVLPWQNSREAISEIQQNTRTKCE